jgi:hypothetical protein
MNRTDSPSGSFDQLQQATMVLLLFQAVFLLSRLFDDGPNSAAMTGILAATVAVSAVNRRLSSDSPGRHAAAYITAWRYGVLALLAVLSVVVAFDTYAPDAMPNGVVTLIAMLLPGVIALKGAVLGKLKPNRVFGLRLPWTTRSHLAWEMAHRLMGRILFFGGLVGLIAAPFVPVIATFVGVACVILIGITAGAIESWRVWRVDPERTIAG